MHPRISDRQMIFRLAFAAAVMIVICSTLCGCEYSWQLKDGRRGSFEFLMTTKSEWRPDGTVVLSTGPDGDVVATVAGAATSIAIQSSLPAIALGVRRGTESLVGAPGRATDNLTTTTEGATR